MNGSRMLIVAGLSASLIAFASAQNCNGASHILNYGKSRQQAYLLSDNSLATRFRAAVNVDGLNTAYHKDDILGGGIISLCNGGRAYPAASPSYNASGSNKLCRQFLNDYNAIRKAGWKDPLVGAINWFGILGKDQVKIGNTIIKSVVPIEQADGSGFYVSPTALEDPAFAREDQKRYLDAGTIPAAVIRNSKAMAELGIGIGTFGVAVHQKHQRPVPFIVGDYGPRIGEATFALGRSLKGLPLVAVTRQNVLSAQIDEEEVLWVFFGGRKMEPPYTKERVAVEALRRFEDWGGAPRLKMCLDQTQIPLAQ